VLEEGKDVFGDCVNVAARMVKLAKPSQIIAAASAWKPDGADEGSDPPLDKLPVKGRERKSMSTRSCAAERGIDLHGEPGAGPPNQAQYSCA